MSLSQEQRVEKIATRLFIVLENISGLNDSTRDRVYTRTIEKLKANGQHITAEGIRRLRSLSLDIQ